VTVIDALPTALSQVLAPTLEHARRTGVPDVHRALELAAELTEVVPVPGGGRTAERWTLLATLAAADLTIARVVEAHLDAVAILAEARQAGVSPAGPARLERATWGVFAAEGPGARLVAHQEGGSWVLDGTKPWCSLAGRLSHALVTAHVDDGRRLFAVALDDSGVRVEPRAWHARGLVDVPSGPVRFDSVRAWPVGETGWYLRRPGFAHGGVGVAACWFGGAVAVARSMAEAASRRPPDQLATWHLGMVDLALQGCRTAFADAAPRVDRGEADGAVGEVLALRVRSAVAEAAEQVLTHAGHALGPAPLALDETHARRVADLTLYLRQHHAERDVARLGELLVASGKPW
jgi:alkylation response protein AidB-like acyl-CoA dehydrogenase